MRWSHSVGYAHQPRVLDVRWPSLRGIIRQGAGHAAGAGTVGVEDAPVCDHPLQPSQPLRDHRYVPPNLEPIRTYGVRRVHPQPATHDGTPSGAYSPSCPLEGLLANSVPQRGRSTPRLYGTHTARGLQHSVWFRVTYAHAQ